MLEMVVRTGSLCLPLERRTTLFHVVAIGLIERSQTREVRKAEFTNIGVIPTIMDRICIDR